MIAILNAPPDSAATVEATSIASSAVKRFCQLRCDCSHLALLPDVSKPGLFTSGAVLALESIVFYRTDSHFPRPILFHLIGEAADMAKNADFAAKCDLFRC